MEDDALVPHSKESSDWRQVHGIRKLSWPTNSPYLKSIENLWYIVKDIVQNEVPQQNQEELVKTIQRAWEEVSLEIIEVLLASMPYCMKAIIKAHGSSSRW